MYDVTWGCVGEGNLTKWWLLMQLTPFTQKRLIGLYSARETKAERPGWSAAQIKLKGCFLFLIFAPFSLGKKAEENKVPPLEKKRETGKGGSFGASWKDNKDHCNLKDWRPLFAANERKKTKANIATEIWHSERKCQKELQGQKEASEQERLLLVLVANFSWKEAVKIPSVISSKSSPTNTIKIWIQRKLRLITQDDQLRPQRQCLTASWCSLWRPWFLMIKQIHWALCQDQILRVVTKQDTDHKTKIYSPTAMSQPDQFHNQIYFSCYVQCN